MKEEGKNIDKVFKDGLYEYSEKPPVFIWDSIEKTLDNERKQKRKIIIWRTIAAASIVGVVLLSGLLFNQEKSYQTVLNQPYDITNNNINPLNNKVQKQTTLADAKQSNTNNYTSDSNINNAKKNNGTYTSYNSNKVLSTVNTTNTKTNMSNNKTTFPINNHTSINYKKLEPKDIDSFNNVSDVNAKIVFAWHNNTQEINQKYLAKDNTYWENVFNTNDDEKELKNKTKLSIGGQFAPDYSYGEASATSTQADKENGIFAISGGINLNIKAKKRWSIETGILYSQVGQQFSNGITNNSQPLFASISKPTLGVTRKLPLNNSMGNIVLNDTYSNKSEPEIGIESSPVQFNKERKVLMEEDIETIKIQQQMEYIEIPLLFRYNILNKSVKVSISGGMSTNFLVGNHVYHVAETGNQSIGKVDNPNNINYSAIMGVGIKAPIWKSISFSMEPRIKYFINPMVKESGYDYRAYNVGIFTGICYSFNK